MPLQQFLLVFAEPSKFCSLLEKAAADLVETWNTENIGKKKGKREPVGKAFVLFQHAWKARTGKLEKTQCEMQLNTFFYTVTTNSFAKTKPISRDDLRVRILIFLNILQNAKIYCFFSWQICFKLRSSVGISFAGDSYADKVATPDGLSYDKFGYVASYPHFANLLSSDVFARFLEAAGKVCQKTAKDAEAAKIASEKLRKDAAAMKMEEEEEEEEDLEEEEESNALQPNSEDESGWDTNCTAIAARPVITARRKISPRKRGAYTSKGGGTDEPNTLRAAPAAMTGKIARFSGSDSSASEATPYEKEN